MFQRFAVSAMPPESQSQARLLLRHWHIRQLHRDNTRDAIFAHRYTIDRFGIGHRNTVMGDDDKLCLLGKRLKDVTEAHDVRLIQRRVYLIQQTEWWRIRFEQGK